MTSRACSLLVESKFVMLGFMCSKLNFGITPQRSSKIHACAIVPVPGPVSDVRPKMNITPVAVLPNGAIQPRPMWA